MNLLKAKSPQDYADCRETVNQERVHDLTEHLNKSLTMEEQVVLDISVQQQKLSEKFDNFCALTTSQNLKIIKFLETGLELVIFFN